MIVGANATGDNANRELIYAAQAMSNSDNESVQDEMDIEDKQLMQTLADGNYSAHCSDYSSDNAGIPTSNSFAMTIKEVDVKALMNYQAKYTDKSDKLLHCNRAFTKNGRPNVFTGASNECLAGYLTIGGQRALVLLDTGSEVQVLSADFARTARINIEHLVSPVILQLAAANSRTLIKYGCETTILVGQDAKESYWI